MTITVEFESNSTVMNSRVFKDIKLIRRFTLLFIRDKLRDQSYKGVETKYKH